MKLVHHVSRAARYALFAALVGSALALSALRFWLLPEASRFRGQLESKAGELLGAQVRIGALSARMYGLQPQLVLRELSVIPKDPGPKSISVREVGLGVSLLQSLLQGSPALAGLRVEGARVTLERSADGTLGVSGLSSGGGAPLWLFSLERLVLKDIDLVWLDPESAGAVALGRLSVSWRNRETNHRLSALMQLAPELGTRIALAAKLTGDGADPLAWQGDLYLEGAEIRLGGPLRGLWPAMASIQSGLASTKLWGRWQSGQLAAARGLADLSHPVLSFGAGGASDSQASLDAVSSRFSWTRSGQGWELALGGLQMATAGQLVPPLELAFALDHGEAGKSRLRVAASELRLEDLRPIQNALPPGVLRNALQAMSPKGLLRQPRLVLDLDGDDTWGLCGALEGLSLQPWNGIPGFGSLRGQVCGSNRRGAGAFVMGAGQMRAPQLWPQAAAIQGLEGRFSWEQGADGLLLTIPALGLQAAGLHGRAVGSVRFHDSRSSPFLDLQARLSQVDARRLREYLPLAAMPANTARWLRDAFSEGQIEVADVLLRGPLEAFPFRGGEGVFQVRADVKDVELAFHPDWPLVQGFTGQVEFRRAGMDIVARSAAIGGVPIRGGQAHAADFDRDPWLILSGTFDTEVREALGFLEKTPLRQIPERVLKYADPQGQTAIDVKLKVYLPSDHDEVRVDGLAAFKNASLEFPSLDLGIRQMAGALRFSEHGMQADGVAGTVLGRPVTLRAKDADETIRVELMGVAGVEELSMLAPEAGLADLMKGSSTYRLAASIPEVLTPSGEPLRLTLNSDLSGLAVLLPAPLGKAAGVKRDLRLELALPAGEATMLRVAYGHDSQAGFWFDEHAGHYSFAGGEMHIGHVVDKMSSAQGLRLRARLGEFDGADWQEFLARMPGPGTPPGLLKRFDVQAENLRWNGKRLGALSVDMAQAGGDWKGRVDGDLAQGDILLKLPQFGYPTLKLDLKLLGLPDLGERGSGRPAAADSLASDGMPAIQLHADRTLWRGADLGTLELATERWTQGLNIKDLSLSHRNHRMQLKGSWLGKGPTVETRLDGKLDIRDLGLFLTGLGYGKEIRDTPTSAQFSLAWPGSPPELSAAGLRGGIDLTLGRGSVLNMEPGLGRALAVLNLDSLKRLLLLDFSDMFGKGLSYDSMRGHFDLGGGQARTNGFLIDAAAGTILISGRVGLVAKDLDETVTVIPHTLASLPMSGVMMGSAAVGAALSVAGKLVGQDSVTIASNRYAIKGSWDDPQVSRIEGNMPLDVLKRAWSGLKNFSGFGSSGEEGGNE